MCQISTNDLITNLDFGLSPWRSLPVQWLETKEGCSHSPWANQGLYHWRSRAGGLCRWCKEWCCAVSEGSGVTWHPRKWHKNIIITETNTQKPHINLYHDTLYCFRAIACVFSDIIGKLYGEILRKLDTHNYKWEVRCWDEEKQKQGWMKQQHDQTAVKAADSPLSLSWLTSATDCEREVNMTSHYIWTRSRLVNFYINNQVYYPSLINTCISGTKDTYIPACVRVSICHHVQVNIW